VTESASRPPTLRRNEGGARHDASKRAELHIGERTLEGWTLNLSRGGARIVLVEEDEGQGVQEALNCSVEIDGDPAGRRPAQVVWVRNEPDGQICGVKFLDIEGGAPP
jgi:hypothetical protein